MLSKLKWCLLLRRKVCVLLKTCSSSLHLIFPLLVLNRLWLKRVRQNENVFKDFPYYTLKNAFARGLGLWLHAHPCQFRKQDIGWHVVPWFGQQKLWLHWLQKLLPGVPLGYLAMNLYFSLMTLVLWVKISVCHFKVHMSYVKGPRFWSHTALRDSKQEISCVLTDAELFVGGATHSFTQLFVEHWFYCSFC